MVQQSGTTERLLGEQALFAIYLEVAREDHLWRRRAMYGDQTPPESHSPFRPLNAAIFSERFQAAAAVPQGHQRFQQQLLRRAHYYRVDVAAALRGTTAEPMLPPLTGLPVPGVASWNAQNTK